MDPFGSFRGARSRPVPVLAVCVGVIAALLPWLGGGLGPARAESPTADRAPAGYWLVAADGGVLPGGAAPDLGSPRAVRLNAPVVRMAARPGGQGYWLLASAGGIFSFGDAAFYGSTGAIRLNRPIVGM